MKQLKKLYLILIVLILMSLSMACKNQPISKEQSSSVQEEKGTQTPAYGEEIYVVLNSNQPEFQKKDMTTESYEFYSILDEQGRCGVAMANLGIDLMPTEERESIGQVRPSGWQLVKYDSVDGKYLYNRCHLIGFQLAGENANERNLITGTRYMNTEGMLPFENMVAEYIRETENHVLYRVTPIFEGDNLVASGVQMEAKSVEDNGEGICFNVFVYNVQPGVEIDYATGNSWAKGDTAPTDTLNEIMTYVLNTNSRKIHYEDCKGVRRIKEENKKVYTGTKADLIKEGYEPCGICMTVHP